MDLFYHVGLNTNKSHFEGCHAPLQNEMTLLLILDVITDTKGWLQKLLASSSPSSTINVFSIQLLTSRTSNTQQT